MVLFFTCKSSLIELCSVAGSTKPGEAIHRIANNATFAKLAEEL